MQMETTTATVNSSTINLTKTIVGAGLLAIPYVFRNDGVLVGILMTVLAAIASGFGLFVLAKCSKTMINPRNSSFFTLCMMTNPSLCPCSDLAMFVQCFGVGLSYLVLIGDLFPAVFGGPRHYWIIGSGIIIIPLCLLKNLNSLRYSSILGLFALAYLTILVIVIYINNVFLTDNYLETRGDVNWFSVYDWTGLCSTFSIIIFAFTGAMNLFSIINELENNSIRNITKVINRSIGISTFLFLLVGISGYLTFGSNTLGNIMLNYDPDSKWCYIGKFCLGSMIVLSFPLLFHPLRIAVNNMVIFYQINYGSNKENTSPNIRSNTSDLSPISLTINDDDIRSMPDDNVDDVLLSNEVTEIEELDNVLCETPFPNHRFYTISLLLLLVMYSVSLTVTSFAYVLAIVGATGGTSISFILPGIFGYKLIGSDSLAIGQMISDSDKFYKKCSLYLALFGFSVMFFSLYLIFIDINSS
ncbi:hypothetical protein Kpol_1003p44 [Vanderwaltozyma polyspora DSM 70294]|uniref:Amino acid transporter transmembrane domain-containing protein n=1 Tax=Vanderwaltozyma polyspora (strain ATCC 22028 / DSM 70294 / BCRC 21397 / CBS 2163 / NBRC 10782 / NRRL Y-8283 / UCD 57-17) TaxID=436907 RepID=A7TM02_VANPO|nr:uncharacterized protein Kpol_1003p44 [Vanderwaltozyma polyspora DSM 70294]EDO16739.1 hypothetical protein Kpol_1003p44 [Vanderwaltozyma polyspora DSM 70294]